VATGVGRVTLAFMLDEERKTALLRARETGARWDSIPRIATKLAAKLAQIPRDGHAFADEEYLEAIYQSRHIVEGRKGSGRHKWLGFDGRA
jgi:DNA-binding IclR family transcriptional regulator